MSDNLREDIDYSKRERGEECLGATSGDFNGDGVADRGILLTPLNGQGATLIAALRIGEGWVIEALRQWTGERNRLYVATAPPGKYKRSDAFDTPVQEDGEVETVESNCSGIVTGRTEASGIYYFWTPKGWMHVWVTD